MDDGWSLLSEMRLAGASFLAGTMDSIRIRAQTRVHVYPHLQANLCLQAVGIRVSVGLSAHQNAYYMKL
jgi:hypothetical protein